MDNPLDSTNAKDTRQFSRSEGKRLKAASFLMGGNPLKIENPLQVVIEYFLDATGNEGSLTVDLNATLQDKKLLIDAYKFIVSQNPTFEVDPNIYNALFGTSNAEDTSTTES